MIDIAGRGGGQPDVQRVEVGQRCLPGAVNGTMTFIHYHNIEISAGIILAAADHGLEQRHGDLFFLPHHAGSQPVAAVLTAEQILNGFKGLLGKLFAIDKKQDPFRPTRLNETLDIKNGNVRFARTRRQFN